MTSVLTEDERRAARMKPKSGNQKISIDGNVNSMTRDETRSFLNFSRENLSMSHSEIEQGFNKPSRCSRVSRQTLLSIIAILVALVCAGIEIWKLHRVLTNTREIEILKRDVETLRHRLFGEDFMDELKAFEEQLHADGSDSEEDSGEADIEGADYDSNYDEDYETSWNDFAGYTGGPTVGIDGTETSQIQPKNGELKSTSSNASRNRGLVEMLAVLHKVEAKRGQEFEQSIHGTRKNIARDRLLDQSRESSREHGINRRPEQQRDTTKDDHPKRRRAVTEETSVRYTTPSGRPVIAVPSSHNHTKHEFIEDHRSIMDKTGRATTEASSWERHPPKKYSALTRPAIRRFSSAFSERKDLRRYQKGSPVTRRSVQPRGMARRHLRAPRQVYAAHYEADSSLFGLEDEHTGNGRARHNEGVFKAWRASDWVGDLGMSRHFTLSPDGRLTVHESGLYLVYGQIHYLDEHDENGFHILVNGHAILQCMVYSPGVGHKSRSCFSAQITVLHAGDRLVLKDVGPARYTLFQHDKSFFGLAKIGDSRQQQQQRHTTLSPETRR